MQRTVAVLCCAGGIGMLVWLRRHRLKQLFSSPASADVHIDSNNILLVLSTSEGADSLAKDFCGKVTKGCASEVFLDKTVYLCGDCSRACAVEGLEAADRVFIIEDLSHSFEAYDWPLVGLGRVPISVHGVGVYYRRFFEPGGAFFDRIKGEHAFQALTESTKPGKAHRTGIYLTPVEQRGDDSHFRLLRCSSNFAGPSDGFGPSDTRIVEALNYEAGCIFQGQAPLNHVLAQIYTNVPASANQKQVKAAIKGHADKTKDMPPNGVMAFVTFYEGLAKLGPQPADPFDLGHKGTSGLTRLIFKLKQPTAAAPSGGRPPLAPQFSVTLYPDSAFFMPLSTNRLYTHEIRPAALDATLLPTRMGYVVRCSAAEAVHRDGTTFLKRAGGLVPLQPPTAAGMAELRHLYAQENVTDVRVDYGRDRFLFSMNQGDYARPTLAAAPPHGFRTAALSDGGSGTNPFDALLATVAFEGVVKGRQGAVLVRPHPTRGCPVVRTTTKYAAPAQPFSLAHARLAERVRASASLPTRLNNALIEVYSNRYARMGAHSDQALDLQEGSAIAVYSCYRHPERATPPPRKLVVEPKEPGGGSAFEIPLAHNSVVTWSLETNSRFRHKIVLDTAVSPPENDWLGVTFRTSKTFVRTRPLGSAAAEPPSVVFEDGTPLTLATEAECEQFYTLRRRENEETGFEYPPLSYTISPSDLLPAQRAAG